MSRPTVVNGLKGVNLLSDPTGIDNNEVIRSKNLFPHLPGTLGTRKAMQYSKALCYASPLGAPPLAQVYDPNCFLGIQGFSLSSVPGVDYVAILSFSGGVQTGIPNVTSAAGDQLWVYGCKYGVNLSTVNLVRRSNAPYRIINVGSRTLVFDGTSSGYVICRRKDSDLTQPYIGVYDSTSLQPDDVVIQNFRLIGASDVLITPLFAVVASNRLVLGSPDATRNNSVFWCDPIDQLGPDSWRTAGLNPSISRAFELGSTIDGPITAMFAAANAPTGYQQAAAIFVFKENVMHQILGSPGYSYELLPKEIAGTYQASRVNVRAGCTAADTIIRTPVGIVWVGSDDVWLMADDNSPHRVGTKIRPILAEQPPDLRFKMHAAYHDGAYKLAVFAPGQGPTLNSACRQQWWLDLRGVEAPDAATGAWFGPQEHIPAWALEPGTWAMTTNLQAGNDSILQAPQLAQFITNASFPNQPSFQMPVVVTFEGFAAVDGVLPTLELRPWQPNTGYYIGDIIAPAGYPGCQVRCTTTHISGIGTSGATEPVWSNISGGFVSVTGDGTCTWTAVNTVFAAGQSWSYVAPTMQNGYIFFDLLSKEFTDPDPQLEKLLDGNDFVWKADKPLYLAVTLSPDLETNEFSPISASPSAFQVLGSTLNMQFNPQWERNFLPPKSDRRSRAMTYQLQLTQFRKYTLPWELRYFTYFYSTLLTQKWLSIDVLNFSIAAQYSATDPRGYTGIGWDFDSTHLPGYASSAYAWINALTNALSTLTATPVSLVSGAAIPCPADPSGQVIFDYGFQSLPNIVSGTFGGVDGIVVALWDVAYGAYSPNSLPAAQRTQLLASNRCWLTLLGWNEAFHLNSASSVLSGPPVNSKTPPAPWPAIVQIKQFGPRVRTFSRDPE